MPTVKDLKKEASLKKIRDYNKLRKDDLLKVLGYPPESKLNFKKQNLINKRSPKKMSTSTAKSVLRMELQWPHGNYSGPSIFQTKIVTVEKAQRIQAWVEANPNKMFEWMPDNGGAPYDVPFSRLSVRYWVDEELVNAFRVVNRNMETSSYDLLYYINEEMTKDKKKQEVYESIYKRKL
jgi:hypothetical protein